MEHFPFQIFQAKGFSQNMSLERFVTERLPRGELQEKR